SGKTSQVAGMNEILNKLIGNDNYLDKRKMSTENTIEDLKKSKKYKVGDTVEVLGHYTKGDGAHHYRQKVDGIYTGEDAIDCVDGTKWKILHNGEINVSWLGAKGDGVTDDTDAIQKAFEYQYFSSRCKVKFGEGTFITSKPLNVYGAQSGYLDFDTFIEGSGRETTFIKKIGSTTSDNPNYTDINAVFIIMNEYQKNNTVDTPYSNQSITRRVHIDTLTLETDSRAIGIYSKGFFYCYFNKIGLKKTSIGMETTIYNCYNRFDSIEVDASNVASFRFLSPIGGNTTAEFRNVHLNGCNGVGYDIKGGLANFFMCTCDGGSLINYQITGSANIENCHYESPNAKSFVKTLSSGRGINISHVISLNNCSIEMPVLDDTVCFDLSDPAPTTFIVGNGTRIHRANRSTSPEILKGKIFSLGEKTILSVGDVKITGITNEGQNIYRDVDFIEIKDIKDFTDTHTYNRYVSSAVSDFSFSQMDISSTDEGYIKLTSKGKANNCNIGQAIFKAIDLTKHNRINVSFKIENESGSGTGAIRLYNEQPCYQGKGLSQTSVKSYSFNYVDRFTEVWWDVSDLVGEHYISIDPSTDSNIIIEKICVY
ncbi:MAG: glycosyl hydrolase family 28-related protein, partial [Cetobacterium sp.]